MSKQRRALIAKIRTVVVVIAIACIPLIYAGALTWANQDPTHNLNEVPAAVVNLDAPAQVKDKTIDLGSKLTQELTTSTKKNNFNWKEYSATDASRALSNGQVLAVLTIPADFSANAASPAGSNPTDAAVARLSVHTNDGANMISGSIATSIAANVRETLATEVSAEYLEQVYLGFTDIHSSISEANDGAAKLKDGTATAKNGSGDLVVGLTDLADGTVRLGDGARKLSEGATSAKDGAASLSAGLNTLNTSAAGLPEQATKLNDGAKALADGANTLADGVGKVSAGVTKLSTGATSARDGAKGLRDGLSQLAAGSPAAKDGSEKLSTSLDSLVAGWDLLTDAQRKAAIENMSEGATTLKDALATSDTAIHKLSAGATTLVGSSEDGTGLSALADGVSALSTGAASASTGANNLRDGLGTLKDGTQALATAAPTLSQAIGSAATGAKTLSTGLNNLAGGAQTLSDSTTTLSDGATKAKTGASDLSSGIGELNDGSTKLSDGLASGLNEIPSYSTDEAKSLSGVTSDPVAVDQKRENEVAGYGYGLAPYFLSLALWVGGLSFYLMFPAMNKRALVTSKTAFGAAMRSFAPGAIMAVAQSTLATLILLGPIGIHAVNPWGLWGMALLTSMTFVAINQALTALLGAPGRFVALILIVTQLSAAGGTYPVETAPSFFQALHNWLPLTHSLEAFRSLIAGGHLGIENALLALTWWLLVAVALNVLACVLARRGRNTRSTVTSPDGMSPLDDDAPAATQRDADDADATAVLVQAEASAEPSTEPVEPAADAPVTDETADTEPASAEPAVPAAEPEDEDAPTEQSPVYEATVTLEHDAGK